MPRVSGSSSLTKGYPLSGRRRLPKAPNAGLSAEMTIRPLLTVPSPHTPHVPVADMMLIEVAQCRIECPISLPGKFSNEHRLVGRNGDQAFTYRAFSDILLVPVAERVLHALKRRAFDGRANARDKHRRFP